MLTLRSVSVVAIRAALCSLAARADPTAPRGAEPADSAARTTTSRWR